jgi:hypothetical protein
MPEIIEDGSGSGMKAKVNGNNELKTSATTISEDFRATKDGDSYNINTGVITLTDAVNTPIMYIKNNEDRDLHITAVAVGLSPSTGGSGGIPMITFVRNPTAGTIITSTPTAVDINSNRNYASSKTLDVDAYKGATGDTMTDGDDHILVFQTSNGRAFITIDEVVPKGSSFGIKFDPQASNTSQDVYAAVICHLEDPNA